MHTDPPDEKGPANNLNANDTYSGLSVSSGNLLSPPATRRSVPPTAGSGGSRSLTHLSRRSVWTRARSPERPRWASSGSPRAQRSGRLGAVRSRSESDLLGSANHLMKGIAGIRPFFRDGMGGEKSGDR